MDDWHWFALYLHLLRSISTIPSLARAPIEQVEAYAQKLSVTCPAKVHQLINEHENYINKFSREWDTHISQASQSLLVKYDASDVPSKSAT